MQIKNLADGIDILRHYGATEAAIKMQNHFVKWLEVHADYRPTAYDVGRLLELDWESSQNGMVWCLNEEGE
jgi:hypothetical protein